MNIIEFNSQICTTMAQSKRLLELGLKPETAECYNREEEWGYSCWIGKPSLPTDIPAWSLHRLIAMLPDKIEMLSHTFYICDFFPKLDKNNVAYVDMMGWSRWFNEKDTLYDNIIDCIEWLIKEVHFNKEYLIKNHEKLN